jgi:hypothetical protein
VPNASRFRQLFTGKYFKFKKTFSVFLGEKWAVKFADYQFGLLDNFVGQWTAPQSVDDWQLATIQSVIY